MKIVEFRAVIDQNHYNENFYNVWVTIFADPNQRVTLNRTYPLDHIKSLFDIIWEDMGKEMKQKLMMEDDKSES